MNRPFPIWVIPWNRSMPALCNGLLFAKLWLNERTAYHCGPLCVPDRDSHVDIVSVTDHIEDAAALSAAATPAWLFSGDGKALLWANPAALSYFKVNSPAALHAMDWIGTGVSSQISTVGRLRDTAPRLWSFRLGAPGRSSPSIMTVQRIESAGSTMVLVIAPALREPAQAPPAQALVSPEFALTPDAVATPAVVAAEVAAPSPPPPVTTKLQTDALTTVAAPETVASPVAETPAPQGPRAAALLARAKPLRFGWSTGPRGALDHMSPEAVAALGAGALPQNGETLASFAERVELEPTGRLVEALRRGVAFNAIGVKWPLTDESERADIELSGAPAGQGLSGLGVVRGVSSQPPLASVLVPDFEDQPTNSAPLTDIAQTALATVPTLATLPDATDAGAPTALAHVDATVREAIEPGVEPSIEPSVDDTRPAFPPALSDQATALSTTLANTGFADLPEPDVANAAVATTAADIGATASEALVSGVEDAHLPPMAEVEALMPVSTDIGVPTAPVDVSKVHSSGDMSVENETGLPPSPSEEAPLPVIAGASTGQSEASEHPPVIAPDSADETTLVPAPREEIEIEPPVAPEMDSVMDVASSEVPLIADDNVADPARTGAAQDLRPVEKASFDEIGRVLGGPIAAAAGTLGVAGIAAASTRSDTWLGAAAVPGAADPLRHDPIAPETATVASDAGEVTKLKRQLSDAVARQRELEAILNTATDGVVLLSANGRILSMNDAAEALFGHDQITLVGEPLSRLIAPESRREVEDYLSAMQDNGVASLLNDGRDITGMERQGRTIPLFMNIGRIGFDGVSPKFCAVLRDVTNWKAAEQNLVEARSAAEKASGAKSDFLAKISHEIRTPLNAIIGFSEVMIEERFGRVENERYRGYINDIHSAGEHVMSLVNDLLDLSKIETGHQELTLGAVNLGDIVQQCVSILQPQANRNGVIMRTSLARLPAVVADQRSVRQILLNLLSNAVKFTRSGGQVFVSTIQLPGGDIALKVRDTGIGMNEREMQIAMEPFRQVANSGRKDDGTGLGLPITKALAEANRATFQIESAPGAGTIVQIIFPATRVLAE
jgi:PAS domain S-box-containing protein